MSMKSLDVAQQAKMAILQKIKDATKQNDEEALASALGEFGDYYQKQIVEQAAAVQAGVDTQILSSRGVRQLTGEETTYFQKLGEAMRSSNPKQAVSDMDVVLPKTTIEAVFEDLKNEHPLLNAIQFQNTSGLIEMVLNTHEDQLGTWGALTSEIVKELTSGFKKITMSQTKYSAFIPVAKAMLDLGPKWLEAYVRTILQETIYLGVEEAIIKGTGKDMPIGMNRQVGDGVTVTGGVYPLKEEVPVTALDPVAYGALLAKLSKTPNNRNRIVQNVIMIVSPADYLEKVMPATTIRGADGRYVSNVLPFPTTIIQSVEMDKGKMLVGLANRYFMGIGTGKSGKIDYSDDYHFLEDERVYLCKLYAHGEPLDNNAFILCDISGLAPAVQEVRVIKNEESANP